VLVHEALVDMTSIGLDPVIDAVGMGTLVSQSTISTTQQADQRPGLYREG
jgi:hypothetical protein